MTLNNPIDLPCKFYCSIHEYAKGTNFLTVDILRFVGGIVVTVVVRWTAGQQVE